MDGEGWAIQQQKLKFRPIKLRRTHNNPIVENLKTISSNKRLAQEMYYGGNHESPLTRSIANIANIQEQKQPVHQRLGVRRLRRPKRNNFNNNFVGGNQIKLRLRRTNPTANGVQTLRRTNFRKPNTVQQRLHRIRFNQQFENGTQFKTKLFRRRRPEMLPLQPTNFTVQVDNPNFKKHVATIASHSVRGSLNQQIQTEIQIIQSQNTFIHELIASEPLIVPGHGFTGIFQNDRFSRLP